MWIWEFIESQPPYEQSAVGRGRFIVIRNWLTLSCDFLTERRLKHVLSLSKGPATTTDDHLIATADSPLPSEARQREG
jgi:hypothetical protein